MFSRMGIIGIFIVAGLIATSLVILAIRNSNPRELAGHKHAIKACMFIPKSNKIATMCYQHVRICTRSGGSPLTVSGHAAELTDIDCNSEGTLLASASKDGTVKLWDVSSGIEVRSVQVCKKGSVMAVAFHPQGQIIATISSDGYLRVWDVSTGAMKKQIKAHSQKLLCMSFNRAGDKIAVGSEKDGVAIWRWETKVEPVLLNDEESGRINAVAFDPTGKYLATGGKAKLIRIWNLDQQRIDKTLAGHWGMINAIEFSPDGQRLVSAASDWTIAVWNVSEEREIKRLRKHPSQVMCIDCDFDSDTILSGGYGKKDGNSGSEKVWKGFLGQ